MFSAANLHCIFSFTGNSSLQLAGDDCLETADCEERSAVSAQVDKLLDRLNAEKGTNCLFLKRNMFVTTAFL